MWMLLTFRRFLQRRSSTLLVLLSLSLHAALLAYSATQHSPTDLEPAFLASGVFNWHFGRFELYRVNPPLPRMVAALPAIFAGCETDWSRFDNHPSSRPEFPVGADFLAVNGPHFQTLLIYGRWMCIPFSLVGGYFAYRWANELYGAGAGFITLTAWIVEPNLLAHAELITADCACWSTGIVASYAFWRWLNNPSWISSSITGFALGVAQLTKFTWLVLYGVWPALWFLWSVCTIRPSQAQTVPSPQTTVSHCPKKLALMQLGLSFIIAIYVTNLGYAFEGTFTRLGNYTFVSTLLAGSTKPGETGNRFESSPVQSFPVPFPRQYILGIDAQRKDFEKYDASSYLCGTWKQGGWWHYYIYGLLVKLPCGIILLFITLTFWRFRNTPSLISILNDATVIAPATVVLVVVSAQLEFNHHLRYAYPSVAFALVACGQLKNWYQRSGVIAVFAGALPLALATISSLLNYPNQLAYFNEFVGGPANGAKHLLGSSLDWGQDLLIASRAARRAEATSGFNQTFAVVHATYSIERYGLTRLDEARLSQLTDANASYLVLVDTTSAMGDCEATRRIAERIQAIGFRTAIEDLPLGTFQAFVISTRSPPANPN